MANDKQRPARVQHERVATSERKPMKDLLKQIPASYVQAQQENTKIKTCCRDVNNLQYQTHKTNPEFEQSNMAILECDVCGCKHYRVAHGPGKVGN
jgi:hypothetical protein